MAAAGSVPAGPPRGRAPAGEPARDRNQVAVLRKAVRLLEAFTARTPVRSVAELAVHAQTSKTATHRILTTLQSAGWVRNCGDGRYALTLRLFELGNGVMKTLSVRDEAITAMFGLQQRFHETVYLFAPERYRAVCVERVEGLRPVRVIAVDVGESLGLLVGAAPRAILAHLGDEAFELALGDQHGPASQPRRRDREALKVEMAAIRGNGYAVCYDEVGPGTAAIGAPVFGGSAAVAGAIGLGGLREHFTEPRIAEMAEALVRETEGISRRLGAAR